MNSQSGSNSKTIKVLLVEDKSGDTKHIKKLFTEIEKDSLLSSRHVFKLDCADQLSAGLEHLAKGGTDVVLLSLSLKDSQGLDAFTKMHTQSPDVPIVILINPGDESLAIEAMDKGACDCLVKEKINSDLMACSIVYSAERQRLLTKINAMALIDEVTGLSSHAAFSILSEHQLRLVQRMETGMFFLLAVFENLESISDTVGLKEADRILAEIADVIKKTFRTSDIIARISENEFVVLGVETIRIRGEFLADRLYGNVKKKNEEMKRDYDVSVNIGIVRYDHKAPCSIEELLAKTRELANEKKRLSP